MLLIQCPRIYIKKINMKNEFVVYLTIYFGDKLPKYYIGSTSKKKIESGKYFGTVRSKRYRKIFENELKYNINSFSVQILSYHETRKEALEEELRLHKKNNVVKSDEYFNESYASVNGFFGRTLKGEQASKSGISNYSIWVRKYGEDEAKLRDIEYRRKQSIVNGGENNPMFNRKNEVIAINEEGKKVRVTKKEFEDNNKLSGHTIGYIYVIDNKTNEYVKLSKSEYSENKDKYSHPNKGITHSNETKKLLSCQRKDMMVAKDWDGNRYRINKNDERLKTGELTNNSTIRWLVTDNNGNEHKVMNIEKFLLSYGILFNDNVKFIDGEVITKHNPIKHKSLVGWTLKRLDKKTTYKSKNNGI